MNEYERNWSREDCPEHIHLCKNGSPRRGGGDRFVVRLARSQCGAECGVVEFVGERLESADCAARFYIRRWTCSRAAFRKIDGRSVVRADRLDECHICRQRSP